MLVLEVPKSLQHCRRVDVLEAFCDWLEEKNEPAGFHELGEVIVELRAGHLLRGGKSVAAFLVSWAGPTFNNDFRVLLALGAEADEDGDDWERRLASLPHELVHVAQFGRLFGGRTPGQVARDAVAQGLHPYAPFYPWDNFDDEGDGVDSTESVARRLTAHFIAEQRQAAYPPACPARCAHYAR